MSLLCPQALQPVSWLNKVSRGRLGSRKDLKTDSSIRIVTRVALTSELIPTVLPAVGLAKQVIMKAMVENFNSTSSLAMVERLRSAINAGFELKGHENLQNPADVIFDQFDFSVLTAYLSVKHQTLIGGWFTEPTIFEKSDYQFRIFQKVHFKFSTKNVRSYNILQLKHLHSPT